MLYEEREGGEHLSFRIVALGLEEGAT